MDDAAKSKGGEMESQPLHTDPKRYVLHNTSLTTLATEQKQFPRCSQGFLPAHPDR